MRTIDARPLWRDADVSPRNAGHHYNHNAETYLEVGDALGRAMAEMLRGTNNATGRILAPHLRPAAVDERPAGTRGSG